MDYEQVYLCNELFINKDNWLYWEKCRNTIVTDNFYIYFFEWIINIFWIVKYLNWVKNRKLVFYNFLNS
jgi:hypothetical protein